MISLNSDALKNSGLSSEKMISIATIIHHASDSATASGGQRVSFNFLTSLEGKSKINLADILYHFEAEDIANCISVQKHGTRLSDFWVLTHE